MRVRMNGHFDRLVRLDEKLERLASEGMSDIEQRAAVAIHQQIERQFARGESAEGERWANKADGSPSHLQKSGNMKRSMRVSGVGGVKLTIDRPAGWHQSGTKNKDGSRRMPERPIAPVGDALPPNWAGAVSQAAREVIGEVRR